MSTRTTRWAMAMTALGLLGGPARAAEDPAVLKDMTAVIALQGQPCGQAVGVVVKGENDHLVTCQDGHRYRVSLSPEGRVLVQRQ